MWGSDGSKAEAVGTNGTLTQFRDGEVPWPTLRQEGPTVFRWAVWEMVKVARQALEAAGHWGVPTFVFQGEPFFGQDRIDVLLWRLGQHGLARRADAP